MEINVSQLLQEPVGATRRWDIDDEMSSPPDGSTRRFTGECRLLHTRFGILTSCDLGTVIDLECNRCLSAFHHPLRVRFEEEFVPTVDVTTGVRLEPSGDESQFTIDQHHVIDIRDAVRQYLLMALPLKPLCSEACAGLCPSCGHNLNEGPCGCPPQDIDSRRGRLNNLS